MAEESWSVNTPSTQIECNVKGQAYVTMAELMVLIDAAMGSLSIIDGRIYWRFPVEQRQRAVNAILARLDDARLEVR